MGALCWAGLSTLLVLTAAFGTALPFRRLLPREMSLLGMAATSLAGGLGLFGALLATVGLFAFKPVTVTALVLSSAIVGMVGWTRLWTSCRGAAAISILQRAKWTILLPVAISAFIVILMFVAGLAPPAGGFGHDGLDYQLLGPRVWLRDGWIHPVPDNAQTAFPPNANALFGALMALGGFAAVSAFGAVWVGLLATQAADLAIQLSGSRFAGAWAAVFVTTATALNINAIDAFNDLPFATLVIAAVRLCLDISSRRSLIAIAVLLGCAMGTKLFGLLIAPATCICILLADYDQSLPRRIRDTATVLAVSTVLASPSYLRNWLVLNCPVYPPPVALGRLMPPKGLPLPALVEFQRYVSGRTRGVGTSPAHLLAVPFTVTFAPNRFDAATGIGLAPLALAPIGFVLISRHRDGRRLILLCLLFTVIWFYTAQLARYGTHSWTLASAAAGIGFAWIMRTRTPLSTRTLAVVVVLLSVTYGLGQGMKSYFPRALAAFIPEQAEIRMARLVPHWAVYGYVNGNPAVKKVLILDPWFAPTLLAKPYVKALGVRGELPLEDMGIRTLDDAVQRVTELHVTHVLDIRNSDPDFRRGDFHLTDVPLGWRLVFEANDSRVYTVSP